LILRMTQEKEYTEKQVCDAVSGSLGIMSTVAKNLGCTWGTARKYINLFPSAQAIWDDEKERVLDLAESKVFKSINLDDVSTAKWLLSCRGKERGYGESLKVDQTTQVSHTLNLDGLTTEEKRQLAALWEKAKSE